MRLGAVNYPQVTQKDQRYKIIYKLEISYLQKQKEWVLKYKIIQRIWHIVVWVSFNKDKNSLKMLFLKD